jgi:hypothetical protein
LFHLRIVWLAIANYSIYPESRACILHEFADQHK